MGKEARSIDTVEDVRKHIGEAAAQMLEKVRADYRKQQLENIALARECIALREAVTTAMAAFAEPAAAYRGVREQIANVRHRLEAIDGFDADLVDGHITPLEVEVKLLRHDADAVRAMELLRRELVAERAQLEAGRLAWLPWRQRRARDLLRLLTLLVHVRQPDAHAFLRNERFNRQKVVE